MGISLPSKFQPPRMDAGQILLRQDFFKDHFPEKSRPKIVFLEGQAGQGKTTLALQLLEREESDYCWYQAGVEDHDPVAFYRNLLLLFASAVPECDLAPLQQSLAAGEVTLLDLPACCSELICGLTASLNSSFTLVFDDLHLLEEAPHTLALLDQFLMTENSRLQFLLVSRRPLALHGVSSAAGGDVVHLENADLAMSSLESMELIHDIMHVPVEWEQVCALHKKISGWTMGLVTAAHALGKDPQRLDQLLEGSLETYFSREIVSQLAEEEVRPLLQLAFLDEIDVELAVEITGLADIGDRLETLKNRNLFVRSLDDASRVYGMHQLFQEFLQQRGMQELGRDTVGVVLITAGHSCLKKGRFEQGCSYLLRAGRYEEIEGLLRLHGMECLAGNCNVSMLGLLANIPEEVMAASPWLRLYQCFAALDLEPEKTIPLTYTIMALFIERGDEEGEMLAASLIVYGHFIFTALYEEGLKILPRARELYDRIGEGLPIFARILVAKNLAMGATLMQGDLAASRRYSDLALNISRQHNIHNYKAAATVSRSYESLFSGSKSAVLRSAEEAYRSVTNEHVSVVNRLALSTYLINAVDFLGDTVGYQAHKTVLLQQSGAEFISRTLAGPSLTIWDIGIAVAAGDLPAARQLLQQAAESGASSFNLHIQSQFLHWQAYVAALEGKREEAVSAARQSLEQRQVVGGPFFIALNRIILGGAYSLLQLRDEAETMFAEALEAQQPGELTEPWVYLQRSFLWLAQGEKQRAHADMRKGFGMMRERGYVNFLGWTPAIMRPVLEEALRADIERDYAKKLAGERLELAIDDGGQGVPLLTIRVLGAFSLEMEGRVICRSEEMPPPSGNSFLCSFFQQGAVPVLTSSRSPSGRTALIPRDGTPSTASCLVSARP